MVKPVNLTSMVHARETLGVGSFEAYLKHYGIALRKGEIDDIYYLVNALTALGAPINSVGDFFVSYRIPQIGKEFDLLRFGPDAVLNIELKSERDDAKILRQLIRNKYYLSATGRAVVNLTFVSNPVTVLALDGNNQIKVVGPDAIYDAIKTIGNEEINRIDDMFDPSEYLVSPFNSTKRFLAGKYFLTHQQEEIRDKILEKLNKGIGPSFFSLSGGPGTGKTLLAYDIAKSAKSSGKSVLVIHCGNLNFGQEELKANGYKIVPIKSLDLAGVGGNNLVIVDEAQRVYDAQLKKIADDVVQSGGFCLFSHDGRQTLASSEAKRDLASKIKSIPGIESFKLSEKIRSNAEIANFIKMLMNRSRKLPFRDSGSIEINYFKDVESTDKYIDTLMSRSWELLRFTPSRFNQEHHEKFYKARGQTSHHIIGQEFDRVAVVIDNLFIYDQNNDLQYAGASYYDPVRMPFQNLTRAKKKINLVIVKNESIFRRCVEILEG